MGNYVFQASASLILQFRWTCKIGRRKTKNLSKNCMRDESTLEQAIHHFLEVSKAKITISQNPSHVMHTNEACKGKYV
jgi:hypothetical protein